MKLHTIKPDKQYLLFPDAIWDSTTTVPLRNTAVYINKGIISRLIPAESISCDTASNSEEIHMPGATLIPGLVDCHVHFSMNCKNLFQAIADWEQRPAIVAAQARQAALEYLENGVTAVRDGSDKMNIGLTVRNEINRGLYPGPMVTATGLAVYRQGKYGSFLGPGVSSIEEALKQVDNCKKSGANQLKVVVSGLVSFKNYGVVGPVQFTVDELRRIIEKAHSLGLKVMAHASSAVGVETAILAGVDSVEHGYFVDTKQLELMAQKGIAWVPTLSPLGNLVSSGHLPYEGADLNVIRRAYTAQLARLQEAVGLGVSIGVGTDAGANHVPHGCSYHDELRYYALAGLSNSEILTAATSVSALIIGQEDLIGTISPGKKPCLLGVPGSPLNSLVCLAKPGWIIIPQAHPSNPEVL